TKVNASKDVKKDVSTLRYIVRPNWVHEEHLESTLSQPQDTRNTDALESSGNSNPTALETLTVETPIPTVSSPVPTVCFTDSQEPSSETRLISKRVTNQKETPSLDNILTLTNQFENILRVTSNSEESNGLEADIISHVDTLIQTRNKSKEVGEQSFIATIHQKTDPALLQFCLFSCFLSQVEPKKISDALQDPSWVEAMQEELLQFKIQKVWSLVDCPKGVRPIGIKWLLKNKKDKRGIVIRNKAMLVAQGHTQEEGIDYDEVFAPVTRIKAIRLFLVYASFMGFTVYQMDVKSAFLYETINEEVGTIDQTLFIRRQIGDFIIVQVYVDDIIFGSSNPQLCREFEALMHEKFQMSAMGELNFFLGLQVLQKEDGIFLSQDKYVGDILKKFGYSDVRSLNTPMDKENPWGKDEAQQTLPSTYSSPTLPPITTANIPPVIPTASLPTVVPTDTPHLRHYTRRARIAQSSALPHVADEPASPLIDFSQEMVSRFEAQELEINSLKARIKLLEDKDRGVADQSGDEALIKGKRLDEGEEAAKRVSNDIEEMINVLTSMDAATVLSSGVAEVPTGSGSILTTGPPATGVPTSSDVVPTAIIKGYAGWKTKDFKGMSFEQIEANFNTIWKQIEDFIPMGSKEETERFKRKGLRLKQVSEKKLKTSEEVPEEVKATKKVLEDKETLSIGPHTSDKEMDLWVKLKRLYEPNDEDKLWTHTQNLMHAPVEWKLYDTCGVHHVTSKDKEMFMLVEKDYPLRKGLEIVMISYKLQVENYSQMENNLILKIYKIANCPSQQVDEPTSPVRDVSEGEACPTDSDFIADQDRATIAKSSTLPYDSAPRVTSPAAVDGTEGKSQTSRGQPRSDWCQSADDAPIKGKRIDEVERISSDSEKIRMDEGEVAVERASEDTEEMATVLTFMDATTVLAGGINVPTGSVNIPTVGPPVVDIHTGSDVVPTASPIVATATVITPYSRRKGKEVMVESDTPKKQSLQEQFDAQVARELEKQQEKENKRMTEQIARDAKVARIHVEEEL
nr:hypothetical protein [Tanacetum cinerariifolium]